MKVIRGNRDTPRNSEVTLQDQEELLRRRRELVSLRQDAAGFVGLVFHSHEAIWFERCASIITEW